MSDLQAKEDVMRRPMVWLRVGLLYLGVTALLGLWAALWPRSFYDDFPWPGHPWVAPLGAYNEHLLRDFGGMNLAMAVVFGVAAVTLDRRLAATALVAYLVFALPTWPSTCSIWSRSAPSTRSPRRWRSWPRRWCRCPCSPSSTELTLVPRRHAPHRPDCVS